MRIFIVYCVFPEEIQLGITVGNNSQISTLYQILWVRSCQYRTLRISLDCFCFEYFQSQTHTKKTKETRTRSQILPHIQKQTFAMTIMAIATANKDKSRVHRKVSQPKFKMNIVDEKSSSSSKLPKHIHPSDHEKEENASDLQQQRELMKALRVANLNASLLTAKLAVESKKTDIDNNQYDPDMTKILDNIVGALDVARTFSKSTQMYERMQRRSPAA